MFEYIIQRAESGQFGVFRVNADDPADWQLMAVYKSQRRAELELGYWQGYRGIAMDEELARNSEAYYEGWDAGNCDRPTLEELTLDVAKVATDPLGY